MKKPDWSNLELGAGVLREPAPDASQLILWLPGDVVDGFRQWERIANVLGAEIIREYGFSRTPVTVIQAKQKVGIIQKVLRLFHKPAGDQFWLLPNGGVAEQLGERITDRVLIWAEPEMGQTDERGVQERFGEGAEIRKVGKNLFVAVKPEPMPDTTAAASELDVVSTHDQAYALLDAGRKEGDCRKQASALVDLGVVFLRDGKVPKALELLQRGLAIARKFKDRALESDAQTNLATALSAAGKMDEAKAILETELAYAREMGDRFHEKLVLGYVGAVYAKLRDHRQAVLVYEQALALARELGDQRHQADLHWSLAIQVAELGDRDRAVVEGQAAIDLLRETGNPKFQIYQEFLNKYRSDASINLSQQPEPARAVRSTGQYQSVVVSTSTVQSGSGIDQAHGPGLLRMALSAAKSMAKFVGSGFKTVPSTTIQKRLEACTVCLHHTGIRCKLCGCFTGVKAKLAHEKCPIAIWPS